MYSFAASIVFFQGQNRNVWPVPLPRRQASDAMPNGLSTKHKFVYYTVLFQITKKQWLNLST